MKRKKPAINVCVGGYDCTGDANWSVADFRAVAKVFLRAAEALEARMHGCIEDEGETASIGLDFGGPFTEEEGLPRIALEQAADGTRCNDAVQRPRAK